MNPFLKPSDLEPLTEPTEEEIAAFRLLNPELAQQLWPIAYEGGIEPDASLRGDRHG